MTPTLSLDLRVLAICTAVLYLKFLVTTMIQGRKAFSAGTRALEDNRLPMAKGKPVQGSAYQECTDSKQAAAAEAGVATLTSSNNGDTTRALAIEDESRWKRMVQNDLESMPLGLMVFWMSIAVGAHENLNVGFMVVYTLARLTHTIVYANQLPLPRMLAWLTGIVCILAAAVNGLVSALAY